MRKTIILLLTFILGMNVSSSLQASAPKEKAFHPPDIVPHAIKLPQTLAIQIQDHVPIMVVIQSVDVTDCRIYQDASLANVCKPCLQIAGNNVIWKYDEHCRLCVQTKTNNYLLSRMRC